MERRIKPLYIVSAAAGVAAIAISYSGVGRGAAALLIAASLGCAVLAAVVMEKRFAAFMRESDELKTRLLEMERQSAADRETAYADSKEQILRFHNKVSHCLRIPISVILGYSALLKGDLVPDKDVQKEYLSRISEKVTYINDILSQLLLEARTNALIPSLVLEPVDICRLVCSVTDDVAAAASKREIVIHVVMSDECILVKADANQLTKVFYNILENSMKYMKRAGVVSITVSRAGGEVMLIFKDDGCGLKPEETEHIFELNYQGSNKTTGEGFGLYFAKTGIQAHGGSIFAKSDVGMGMGIYISIPVCEEEHPGGLSE
jgi:signal transduction histidine kinase